MENLKQCPFCGQTVDLWLQGTRFGHIVLAQCSCCGATSKPFGLSKSDSVELWETSLAAERATEAWNRRVSERGDSDG